MGYRDLRDFLQRLKQEGELIEIEEELDPKYEVTAILEKLGKQESPAVLFKNVKGYNIPVAGNLLGSRKRLALILETTVEGLHEEYLKRKSRGIPSQLVSHAPVKDIVVRDNIDIMSLFPVLTNHELDAAPYITQGLVFMRDPASGRVTVGVHRLQVKGKNCLCIQLVSRTSTEFYRHAEEKNEPLEVAIAIGVDPALLLTAVTWFPFGDKIELAGGLRGAPLELVKGETVGLSIPAHAMIVLERKIPPFVRETDGPFGESSGYYTTVQSPVVEIQAVCCQKDPIYAVFKPWSIEDDLILNISWAGEGFKKLKNDLPSLQGLKLSWNASTAIISIKKRNEGEARRAIYLALMNNFYIKQAIVVDDDVDIYNPREVEWAIATRFQPDRDLVVIPNVEANPLDPSVRDGIIGSKFGIDATKPLGEEDRFKKIGVPPVAESKARKILERYNL
ncbi:UbiD family decarboxylase [Desulfobacterium sp. N47]